MSWPTWAPVAFGLLGLALLVRMAISGWSWPLALAVAVLLVAAIEEGWP